MKKQPVTVEINNFNAAKAKMVTTTEQKLWREKEMIPEILNGNSIINLKAESVNTLIF